MKLIKNLDPNSTRDYTYGQWAIRKGLDGLNDKTVVWRGFKPPAWNNRYTKKHPAKFCEEFTLKKLCQTIQKREEQSGS